ncbi:MAG: hypothetical protein WDN24_17720 [Sphingomonas sp.]
MTLVAEAVPSLDIDPFDEEFLADPYRHHEALREAGPVVWLEKLGCYGMARYAEVQASLKDWQGFCSGRGVGLADSRTKRRGARPRCCSRPIRRSTTAPAG